MAITLWPAAVAAAKTAGVNRAMVDEFVEDAAVRNQGMLIGGYAVDSLIVGVFLALRDEDIGTGEINERLDYILSCAYEGLI